MILLEKEGVVHHGKDQVFFDAVDSLMRELYATKHGILTKRQIKEFFNTLVQNKVFKSKAELQKMLAAVSAAFHIFVIPMNFIDSSTFKESAETRPLPPLTVVNPPVDCLSVGFQKTKPERKKLKRMT
jgi:hypothetical protein